MCARLATLGNLRPALLGARLPRPALSPAPQHKPAPGTRRRPTLALEREGGAGERGGCFALLGTSLSAVLQPLGIEVLTEAILKNLDKFNGRNKTSHKASFRILWN